MYSRALLSTLGITKNAKNQYHQYHLRKVTPSCGRNLFTYILPGNGELWVKTFQSISVDLKKDHVGGSFEWEIEPNFSCGNVKQAVEDRFLCLSNFTDQGSNIFYVLLVGSDGTIVKNDGVPISHCPWCGDKIDGHKKYAA
jgi:hypothetical protein